MKKYIIHFKSGNTFEIEFTVFNDICIAIEEDQDFLRGIDEDTNEDLFFINLKEIEFII